MNSNDSKEVARKLKYGWALPDEIRSWIIDQVSKKRVVYWNGKNVEGLEGPGGVFVSVEQYMPFRPGSHAPPPKFIICLLYYPTDTSGPIMCFDNKKEANNSLIDMLEILSVEDTLKRVIRQLDEAAEDNLPLYKPLCENIREL
ncbi:hypothetical protein AKJ62_01350 [candidate division MSBL1 archaeon SCGC-AAA259D14]|uniref:Uncharacterized protein n=1 Tax=candidate division MSBL1 archaeon SCGC-AAA259D14 TaxID=1698261 RepID=A0A133U7N2_9EURY|nr:hypothetical protein AKJ62_01350 [candidate division MSBL1 archaeon SCGC-AAA259D14]